MTAQPPDGEFEALLVFLREARGFDFTGYKRNSLRRRMDRRLQALGLPRYEDYRDYLRANPDEFGILFNTILINVTSFFRDPEAWEFVATEIVPAILQTKDAGEPVRLWSAGCASGEEAYSLAIIFAEAMGEEAFQRRVKIYSTDVDEQALAEARRGVYGEKALASVAAQRRERFFERAGERFHFRPDLRRSLIFGRHDLVQDAPISRVDLLACRNTLMYFNPDAQSRIVAKFHFALKGTGHRHGYLFLGRAEMLLPYPDRFQPVDLRWRVFARNAKEPPEHPRVSPPDAGPPVVTRGDRLLAAALEETPVPRIVVDADGVLAHANQRARVLFSIHPKDVGRPLQDLEISYRPLELRSLIEQAHAERRALVRTSVERRFPSGDVQYLDATVAPLYEDGSTPVGAAITFFDVTRVQRLQEELRAARDQLQSANEELQSANEELETTNEELQSSNEELETTNEELQSTNEELETMNEELQSTNEELQAVNDELRRRTEEASQSQGFTRAVVASIRSAAIALNRDLVVTVWNHRAADLWGMREEEVLGRSLSSLEIGLPVEELHGLIESSMRGEEPKAEVVLDAVNRRGRKIRLRVACATLVLGDGRHDGAVLTMDEV